MRRMPRLVTLLSFHHSAWVVGSAADPEADLENVRDWDIIVPFSEWKRASALVPRDATVNTFGGWKAVENGIEIDVWPGELAKLMTATQFKYAWQPHQGVRIKRLETNNGNRT